MGHAPSELLVVRTDARQIQVGLFEVNLWTQEDGFDPSLYTGVPFAEFGLREEFLVNDV